jgi:hypothetical protein
MYSSHEIWEGAIVKPALALLVCSLILGACGSSVRLSVDRADWATANDELRIDLHFQTDIQTNAREYTLEEWFTSTSGTSPARDSFLGKNDLVALTLREGVFHAQASASGTSDSPTWKLKPDGDVVVTIPGQVNAVVIYASYARDGQMATEKDGRLTLDFEKRAQVRVQVEQERIVRSAL